MGNYDLRHNTLGPKKWTESEKNIANGCANNCLYCHAKAVAIQFKRNNIEEWQNPRIRTDRRRLKPRNPPLPETVMFPSTHDITPDILPQCLEFIGELLGVYSKVLIVSKPSLVCIKAICERYAGYKDRIAFRFTIGSCDSATLKFWEPGAPDFSERMESLKYAHSEGFLTGVSCEPMLDEDLRPLLEKIRPFVSDTILMGRLNMPRLHLESDGRFPPELERRLKGLLAAHDGPNLASLYSDAYRIFNRRPGSDE